MKKKRKLALLTALLVLLAACAGPAKPQTKVYDMEDKIPTAFFDYTVTAASAHQSYQGKSPGQGERFVEVELTIKNTSSYAMPMGRYDFQLHWGDGGDSYCYPEEQFCEEQLPDKYDIPVNEKIEGKLLFEVPAGEEDLALGYLEIFEDESQGDAFFTYFTV